MMCQSRRHSKRLVASSSHPWASASVTIMEVTSADELAVPFDILRFGSVLMTEKWMVAMVTEKRSLSFTEQVGQDCC